jgi:hypothetical protein
MKVSQIVIPLGFSKWLHNYNPRKYPRTAATSRKGEGELESTKIVRW